jgi:FAD:protein FMN transferase
MQPILNAILRLARLGFPLLVLKSLSLVPSLCVASGQPSPIAHHLHGTTMGTTYHIKLLAPDAYNTAALHTELKAELETINQSMSTYRADSELSKINRAMTTNWIEISEPLYTVLHAAFEISRATDGAFDVTIGPLVNLWGFGPEVRTPKLPSEASIAAAHARVGYRRLSLRSEPPSVRKTHSEIYIDLSAIAKGYAVDTLASILERHGHQDFMVEIGGEATARGHNETGRAWRIALESPTDDPASAARVLNLSDDGLASSGDYRNFFEFKGRRYSHEIDPRTGWPISHALTAVSVVHPSVMWADAYATAMMILGPVDGLRYAHELELPVLFTVRRGTSLVEVPSAAFAEKFNGEDAISVQPPPSGL